MWICLFSVRVVRTLLVICLCAADSKVSLCDVQICDCIVFDVWYVVTTLSMFFGVFLGWCTAFEIFECIRETDTTERFYVFGRKTSVRIAKTTIMLVHCKV